MKWSKTARLFILVLFCNPVFAGAPAPSPVIGTPTPVTSWDTSLAPMVYSNKGPGLYTQALPGNGSIGAGGGSLGQPTPGSTAYLYLIYLNTNWNCDNCNGEQSSALIPVAPTPAKLPPGKYWVWMSFTMTDQDTNGRWVKVNNFRLFDVTTNNTIAQSGGFGQISCDGCWPWVADFTVGSPLSSSTTYTTKNTVTPYFGFDVQDSSHNETYWLLQGWVAFVPTP